MRYSARDFAVCMDRALWQSVKIAHDTGGTGNIYYLQTVKACRKLTEKLGIPWKEVMDSLPPTIDAYKDALVNSLRQDLWEKVAHPNLLVDNIMEL